MELWRECEGKWGGAGGLGRGRGAEADYRPAENPQPSPQTSCRIAETLEWISRAVFLWATVWGVERHSTGGGAVDADVDLPVGHCVECGAAHHRWQRCGRGRGSSCGLLCGVWRGTAQVAALWTGDVDVISALCSSGGSVGGIVRLLMC